MPKVLDVAERERLVVDAAWRVIARGGIEALTVRTVAAEAGLPPSSLRYTFPTQQAVRERAVRAFGDRLRSRLAALPGGERSAEWARAALLELLPLDGSRRLEAEVYFALGAAALSDDALQPLHRESVQVVRDVCTRAAAALGSSAEVDARLLHAVVDGLALHLVQDPGTAPAVRIAVLDRAIESVGR